MKKYSIALLFLGLLFLSDFAYAREDDEEENEDEEDDDIPKNLTENIVFPNQVFNCSKSTDEYCTDEVMHTFKKLKEFYAGDCDLKSEDYLYEMLIILNRELKATDDSNKVLRIKAIDDIFEGFSKTKMDYLTRKELINFFDEMFDHMDVLWDRSEFTRWFCYHYSENKKPNVAEISKKEIMPFLDEMLYFMREGVVNKYLEKKRQNNE